MAEKVLVVGAGVIGAAIAFRLAQAGCRVTVVDADTPASGASGRSFGWLNASFFADPHHFRLRVAALAEYRALDADLGSSGLTWPGALNWEEEGSALEAMAAELEAMGYPLRRIGRAEFSRLEPAIANPPEAALCFPGEGAADLRDMTLRFLAGAARHGARFCFGLPVEAIRHDGGRVTGLATAEGPLDADRVVIAAGTGATALLAPLGQALPMLRRPALVLRTQPVAPLIHHILVAPGQELRQEPDGRILAPTSANHQGDNATDLGDLPEHLADAALDRLQCLLPSADLRWESVIRAFRPVPGDGLPVVGEGALPGLYLAVMHSGATLAALVGKLVAEEITSGISAPLLAPYRPARFA